MKRVISVSLGAPEGDFCLQLNIAGEQIRVERIGTGGSLSEACKLLNSLDGSVDVLCLGGANKAYYAGDKAYPLPAGQRLASQVSRTPLVDGQWVKEYLEPEFVQMLARQGMAPLYNRCVLLVSALDRPKLAAAFEDLGCSLLIGDAAFGLGFPLAFHSLATFTSVASLTLPLLRLLPLTFLYPLGDRQNQIKPRFGSFYKKADIIAGDFHFIYRHLPPTLEGKIIVTGTVRTEDIEQLRLRGARLLITFFPAIEGRALAANVWEGILLACLGQSPKLAGMEAVWRLMKTAGLGPRMIQLN